MAEYIERKAAYSLAKKICDAIDKVPRCILGQDILDFIDDIPSADVRPVVRGKWKGVHSAECSECGHVFPAFLLFEHYCPSCGAEMERVE